MAIKAFFGIFWENILLTILLLIGVWELIVHGNFSLIQANHILKMRWISHYVDITYVFLYLIFRCFIFIENCNAVYCEYYIKICNFIFIFRRKKKKKLYNQFSIQGSKVHAIECKCDR